LDHEEHEDNEEKDKIRSKGAKVQRHKGKIVKKLHELHVLPAATDASTAGMVRKKILM